MDTADTLFPDPFGMNCVMSFIHVWHFSPNNKDKSSISLSNGDGR